MRLLFIILIGFNAYGQTAPKCEDVDGIVEPRDESEISVEYSGVVKKCYKNGQIRCLYNVRNGCITGVYKEWWYNGELAKEVNYKIMKAGEDLKHEFSGPYAGAKEKGVKEGVLKEYYPNGAILSEIHYHNGKRDGIGKEWDENGLFRVETIYKDGVLTNCKGECEEQNAQLPVGSNTEDLDREKSKDKLIGEAKIYTVVDKEPVFNRGWNDKGIYIGHQVKEKFPEIPGGTIYLKVIINKDGSAVVAEVIRGLTDNADEYAIKLFNETKDWTPGVVNNEPVRTYLTLPIKLN